MYTQFGIVRRILSKLTAIVKYRHFLQKNYYLESTVPGSSGNLLLDKFTTTWNEKVTCAACLVFWSFLVGTVFCYIANGGPLSKVYYGLTDYSLWWLALQFPVLVVYQVMNPDLYVKAMLVELPDGISKRVVVLVSNFRQLCDCHSGRMVSLR